MTPRACANSLICALSILLSIGSVSATTINSVTLSGTQLTISGNGFSGTPLIVTFNGKSIPIVSSSTSQIIATLNPVPSPGSYRLGVRSGTVTAGTVFSIAAPSVIATVALLNQTANIPQTALWTPPTNGLYRYTVYLAQTVLGTHGGEWFFDLSWNDAIGAQNVSMRVLNDSLNEQIMGNAIRLVAGQPISYFVNDQGTGGTGTYEVVITLEQLTSQ